MGGTLPTWTSESNGEVLGVVVDSPILWKADGSILLTEHRAVRIWHPSTSRRVYDYEISLVVGDRPVHLAGDPHHAGFQVRLDQRFAEEDGPKVEYLRPEGASDKGNDVWEGCDWAAGIFEWDDQPYALVHMDATTNPRPARYSTRAYGRFGSTFELALEKAERLELRYRLVLVDRRAEPEFGPADCEALFRDFASPVLVTPAKR